MKAKLIASLAIAGGLTVAMAGTASAASLSHPKPKPKHPHPVTQITGKQLAKGLLPGSAFGPGITTSQTVDSGNKLLSSQALVNVSSEPCSDLIVAIPAFGQTAIAENSIDTGPLYGVQSISQFKNGGAAWYFYQQEKARYNSSSCVTYSTSLNEPASDGGTLDLSINVESVSNTKVGGHSAFAVNQTCEASDSLGDVTFTMNTTVVSDGTNIYSIWETANASTPIPNSLLTSLISRTQALYKG
jgi:hypothetical protein